jgi:FKBP-type peptidyl-prolyl cis-trans isomerase
MKKLFAISVCCAALLASCGGSPSEEAAVETAPESAPTGSAPEVAPIEAPAVAPPETAVQPPPAAPQAAPKSMSQPTGMQTTASGLKYEVLKMGTGAKPTLADNVTVHYRGQLTNGTVFDSSYDRGQPATFPLGRVVKGWQEGVQLMPVGSTFRFEIPPDLGYGARGAGDLIPPNATLIFQVELISIN